MVTANQVEMVDLDPNGYESQHARSRSVLARHRKPTVFGVTVLIGLVALAIVLSIALTGSSQETNAAVITTTAASVTGERIDCVPWLRSTSDQAALAVECAKYSYCVYQPAVDATLPVCFVDRSRTRLKLVSQEETRLGKSLLIDTNIGAAALAHSEANLLKIDFEFLEESVLRFKIYRPHTSEYEVPIQINKPSTRARQLRYDVELSADSADFYFKIVRKDTGAVIWDTSLGPIIFEKFHKQIATRLPTEFVYGLGENRHESFKHNMNYQHWPVFARDEAPENAAHGNLYGSQPFYTCMEEGGKSHGVVLVNSNAFDYELIPAPGLIYRVSGGILDFYVFLGPEPESVIQQYTQYFGRTFMPPYWALGFQVSRFGYKNLDDMKQVLTRFTKADIPLDTQVADIDHYDQRKDFTIDPINWKGMPEYFDELHRLGMKTVMILDPALAVNDSTYWPYTTGRDQDVFIKWPGRNPDFGDTNSSIMLGFCWPPAKVAYPDFLKRSTHSWWIDSIMKHHSTIKFDGLWIDMNEPAVFGTNEERPFNWPKESRPYWSLKCPNDEYELVRTKASYRWRADNKLSDKTLCMSGLQGEQNEYRHYDVHNLYGLAESIPTFEAAKRISGGHNARGFVISRSTFIGSGKYGGHWTGDNHSLWRHMLYSIIGMLEFNLFGIPYVGADICGFWLNTTMEMCARWSALGAFYPFSRNHNNNFNIDQDPAALGENVTRAAKDALRVRYQLLPYYYTLFYKAHSFGNTVARPLFHEYPADKATYSIDEQFLIGAALLVTPVLHEGRTSVTGYFPADRWYSYYDGALATAASDTAGVWLELDAPLHFIPVHVRGGFILPTQREANNTEFSRRNPFGLVVAPDSQNEAVGDLFYDDGKSELSANAYYYATMQLRDNTLSFHVEHNTYPSATGMILDSVRLLVSGVTCNSSHSSVRFVLNRRSARPVVLAPERAVCEKHQVVLAGLQLPMSASFELEWTSDVSDVDAAAAADQATEAPLVDCSMLNASISREDCERRRCAYDDRPGALVRCRIPATVGGYMLGQSQQPVDSTNSLHFNLTRADSFQLFAKHVAELKVVVTRSAIVGNGVNGKRFGVARIQITDANNDKRYRVPFELNLDPAAPPADLQMPSVQLANDSPAAPSSRAHIEVKSSDNKVLFTTRGVEQGLVYCDQFLQIVLRLATYRNVYGLGENSHYAYRHGFSHASWWGVFGRDQPPGAKQINLYGAQPFFMAVDEATGRAFGLLLLNSNALEYGLLPPAAVSLRTLGGILDLYVLEEQSPELLIQAYTHLIGKPYLPPYWALGFQLCKYGYNSLDNLRAAVERTRNAQIPLDIQYADIDYMEKRLDFTFDQVNFAGLPEYIKELRSQGVRFIIILDPAIDSEAVDYKPFTRGKQNDVYIKWPVGANPQLNESATNDNPYVLGYVWPDGKTTFPDYFKAKTRQWWIDEITLQYNTTLTFDGLWIDMNEPANFDTNLARPWNWPMQRPGLPDWNLRCPQNDLDDPPYVPLLARNTASKRLSDKTICMSTRQGEREEYSHYDVHNLYGWSQSKPTLDAARKATQKRSIVISRSTFVSSGTSAGHWLGDNRSEWPDLKLNIIGMLEFNLFGIPYIGADICGFFGNANKELCTRWMQLGAFNTFFRNHNGFDGTDQDPAALGPEVAASSKRIIEIRYSLLPYLYTLFYQTNQNGGTVIRSLGHEFPTDSRALGIDRQFLWGSSLLISPVLDANRRSVYAYFPAARWFDFYTGAELSETGRVHELSAPLDFLPLHVRGNSILLTQEPAVNTELSRKNPYGLIIAPGAVGAGVTAEFYFDDGDAIEPTFSLLEFTYSTKNGLHTITGKTTKSGHTFLSTNKLDTIRLLGVPAEPMKFNSTYSSSTNYTGGSINLSDYQYSSASKELTLVKIGLDLVQLSTFSITIA